QAGDRQSPHDDEFRSERATHAVAQQDGPPAEFPREATDEIRRVLDHRAAAGDRSPHPRRAAVAMMVMRPHLPAALGEPGGERVVAAAMLAQAMQEIDAPAMGP